MAEYIQKTKSKQQVLYERYASLRRERESWIGHWQELSRFFAPRVGRFVEPDAGAPNNTSGVISSTVNNRGEKKHGHILDNSALRSVDILVAGLMSGMTSPARPWFRLKTPDEQLNQRHSVRVWLDDVERKMRTLFAQSNTYRSFMKMYEEIGVFGTAASIEQSDFKDTIRSYPLTIGEYAIDVNEREEVDTLYRHFGMTVGQVVGRFGLDRVSSRVKGLYDRGELTQWISVIHGIEPRRERDPFRRDNLNMPWRSCYFELGSEGDVKDKLLRESGFLQFPAVVPRWKVNGHDFYGEAPAMRALGDNKQLQHQSKRKSQAIDFMTLPALQIPTSLHEAIELGPGSHILVDSVGEGIKPAWDVNLNLQYLMQDTIDVRQRIAQMLFEDIFLMFTTTRKGVQPPTAEEIVAQQEEKLIMLGPVLENLHYGMLSPKIERTFAIMIEAGMVPPAPPELEGMPLVVQFISTLAQAQQLVGLSALDRMIGTMVNLSSVKPAVLDKLDGDKVIETYADALGVDPDLIVADDQVALIRSQRAQEQQQAKLAAALPDAARTAGALGSMTPNAGNAAIQALQQLGGTP